MNSQFATLRLCLFLFFFTIFSSASGDDKKYFLETKPSGADVLNMKSEVIGKTPFDISRCSYSKDSILIAMKDYDTTTIAFNQYTEKKYFPTVASWCEPCEIEMKNSDTKEEQTGILVLRKSRVLPENDVKFFTTLIEPFQFAFTDTTFIGTIDKKKMKWGDKVIGELIDRTYHEYIPVTTGLKNSYLNIVLYDDNNSKKKNPIRFRLNAKFTNLKIDFSHRDKILMRGHSSMDAEFELYNKFDSLHPVADFKIHSSIYRTQNKRTNFLKSLIHDAEMQLMSIDTLYDFLCKQDERTSEIAIGEEIKIARPPLQTFVNLKEINRYASPNVVTIDCKRSFGSGFFISNNGYLVTNNHVIEDENKITVVINKDLKVDATVVKTNEEFDLALLKVDYDSLPGLWFADSDSIEDGDPVVAIGTPLDRSLSSTLTKGIVSGQRNFSGTKLIQTDVSVNSGNSGGPLINSKGEVIGMTTLKVKAKGVEGIAFCIPSNEILKRLNIVYK